MSFTPLNGETVTRSTYFFREDNRENCLLSSKRTATGAERACLLAVFPVNLGTSLGRILPKYALTLLA